MNCDGFVTECSTTFNFGFVKLCMDIYLGYSARGEIKNVIFVFPQIRF